MDGSVPEDRPACLHLEQLVQNERLSEGTRTAEDSLCCSCLKKSENFLISEKLIKTISNECPSCARCAMLLYVQGMLKSGMRLQHCHEAVMK